MSLFVDSSQEETFNSVMDYFTTRRMRILTSNSPNYMRGEFGNWFSMSSGNAKGEVEVSIMKKDNGSYVSLNFNFFKDYMAGLFLGILGSILVYLVVNVMLSRYPQDYIEFIEPSIPFFVIAGILIVFGIVTAFSAYDVSKTRGRFIEEFNMFIQSTSKKA